MSRIPLQIDRTVDEIQPAYSPLAEDQRQRRDLHVELVSRVQVRLACPIRVRKREPLGIEFDPERCEIQLKIAADGDGPMRHRPDDSLERMLQKAPLGDIQHQPDRHDQRDDPEQDVADDMPLALFLRFGRRGGR
jgi:hypothetical protein